MMNVNPKQIWQIASYSMRYSVRTGGGLIYLLSLLIGGLGVAAIYITPLENIGENMGMEDDTDVAEMADQMLQTGEVAGFVEWVTDSDEEQSKYLLTEHPALMTAIMLTLLLIIPYTTCLGAFNQTSGDIGSKGLRFLLMRAERTDIYLGRFLGTLLFTIAASVAVVVLIVTYIHFKFRLYPFGDLVSWGIQGLFAILVLSVPYIALCSWISGKIGSAFVSLVLCVLAITGPILFILFARSPIILAVPSIEDGDLNWMWRVLPFGWKFDMLHHNFGTRALALLVQTGFTVAFMFLGLRSFNRRDL